MTWTELERAGSVPAWTLGDRMAKARRAASLSTNDMTEFLEAHRNSVTGWERDRIRPKLATLRLWAMRCGVPLDWLRYGVTESEDIAPRAQLKCIAISAGQTARAAG
jgi:transcriptional regulator with XRE-family HTH domain